MGDIFCCHHYDDEIRERVLETTKTSSSTSVEEPVPTNVVPPRVLSPTKQDWDFCEEKDTPI